MDASIIVNLKYIAGMCLMMVLGTQGSRSKITMIDKLAEEVVSIYGDNFGTPESREPYYIKIHRCINIGTPLSGGRFCWSVPASRKEIEIVVPDVNNETKFYKYVVYNDTSCTCGTRDSGFLVKQHKNLISHEISEVEFKTKLPNNPDNLRSCKASFCSEPQPRYMINPWRDEAECDRYILYHQCLPGCKRTKTYFDKKLTSKSGFTKTHRVSNDTACSSYKQKKATAGTSGALKHGSLEASYFIVSQNGMLINIGSTKLLLAAFVLSVILLSILIVDCNLCHRKKGLLYNLLCCKKDTTDIDCPDCAERRQNMIEEV